MKARRGKKYWHYAKQSSSGFGFLVKDKTRESEKDKFRHAPYVVLLNEGKMWERSADTTQNNVPQVLHF